MELGVSDDCVSRVFERAEAPPGLAFVGPGLDHDFPAQAMVLEGTLADFYEADVPGCVLSFSLRGAMNAEWKVGRRLVKAPALTIVATLTLALGIGANAAMFGVVDRLLFRPPSYLKDPDRVHRVYLTRRGKYVADAVIEGLL